MTLLRQVETPTRASAGTGLPALMRQAESEEEYRAFKTGGTDHREMHRCWKGGGRDARNSGNHLQSYINTMYLCAYSQYFVRKRHEGERKKEDASRHQEVS